MPTENDWLHGHDAIAMAAFLHGRVTDRKLRLIACACCRQLESATTPDWGREALDAAERFAEGQLLTDDLERALQRVLDATAWAGDWADETPEENTARAIRAVLHPKASSALRETLDALERAAHLAGKDPADALERSRKELIRQAAVIREVVGNPIQPLRIGDEWKRWHGGCLVLLARDIYKTRTFQDIPILGDMLEDAGCHREDLLNHCRLDNLHALGCWVIDEILDKR